MMQHKKLLLLVAILFIGIVFLIISSVFMGKKTSRNTPASKSHQVSPSVSPVNTFLMLTPESMRGEVKARLAAPFQATNNSNISGTTTFLEINGKVFVGVELKNASSDSTYPAYIHFGSCAEQRKTKYSLSPVVKGKTENYIRKTMAEFKKEFPLSVKIHKSEKESDVFLSCADLQ